jgi:hypothetical protein
MSENAENMNNTNVYTHNKVTKINKSGKYGGIDTNTNIDKCIDINAYIDTIVRILDVNTSYENITRNVKVTVPLLRAICQRYKLKRSGKKQELIDRIKTFLVHNSSSIRIQSFYRGYLLRRFLKYICHYKCYVNEEDFLSLENFKSIPFYEQISIQETDFIYGFHIYSLAKLLEQENPTNPYTRKPIERIVFRKVSEFIRLAKLNHFSSIPLFSRNVIKKQISLDNRVTSLFVDMDYLGHTTDTSWFYDMHRNQCLKFIRDLIDIWNYRANIPRETKTAIYPPNGNPFFDIYPNIIMSAGTTRLRKHILDLIDRFVNSGTSHDMKFLGSSYILCAFTLNNRNAATQLPWYYESVRYI